MRWNGRITLFGRVRASSVAAGSPRYCITPPLLSAESPLRGSRWWWVGWRSSAAPCFGDGRPAGRGEDASTCPLAAEARGPDPHGCPFSLRRRQTTRITSEGMACCLNDYIQMVFGRSAVQGLWWFEHLPARSHTGHARKAAGEESSRSASRTSAYQPIAGCASLALC